MYMYMFGAAAGAEFENFAADMKARGIDAVVSGSFTEHEAEILAKNSLDAYLCYGAFSREGFEDSHLAVDFNGVRRVWFGSGCPSDKDIALSHINAVAEKAKNIGVKGVFSDGARYASFASPEGRASFWTCFCPKCMSRAERFGVDLESARFYLAVGERHKALEIMKKFRGAAMKEYFALASVEIKKANPSLLVGAFIFPSSLAPYVGQEKVTDVDILAPMLYRAYPHPEGPACLNHEWAAAMSVIGSDLSDFGKYTKAHNADSLLKLGFEPERLRFETEAVKGDAPLLMPIIQLEDSRLGESIAQIEAAGADGCGFLAYSAENMKYLDCVSKKK